MKNPFDNYTPYGDEWRKEMMKLPKKTLIEMYRKVCVDNYWFETYNKLTKGVK